MPGDTEPEKVEECNADGYDNSRPKHAWGANCLVPTASKVKERRASSNGGDGEDGNEDENRDEAEKSFKPYSNKWSDGIATHYFLFQYELCSGAR